MLFRSLIPTLLLLLLLAGCAGTRSARLPASASGEGGESGEDDTPILVPWAMADSSIGGVDPPDLPDSLAAAVEARLLPADQLFDYPVVVNRRVLTWIDTFLGRGRRSFENSLRRSGRYLPMARQIFRESGIPQDLAFLAHVESGFRPEARSPKAACGLWQFMRATAKLYDLRCDDLVDERIDPEASTRAAARLLRHLHERYDDWYLALAAYNAGPGRVDRAIKSSGSRDFWEIARTPHLRNETRNFVPAILAATILAKSPTAYGLTGEVEPPLEYDTLVVHLATDLQVIAGAAALPLDQLAELNPALLCGQTPPDRPTAVRLPAGSREQVKKALIRIPAEQRILFRRHKVRRGDTLYDLARRYETTISAIQTANGMGRSTLLSIGQSLRIPTRSRPADLLADRAPSARTAAVVEHAVLDPQLDLGRVESTSHIVEEARRGLPGRREDAREGMQIHVVQRGDTLAGIGRRYGVPLASLYRMNGLGPRSVLRPGQQIITHAR